MIYVFTGESSIKICLNSNMIQSEPNMPPNCRVIHESTVSVVSIQNVSLKTKLTDFFAPLSHPDRLMGPKWEEVWVAVSSSSSSSSSWAGYSRHHLVWRVVQTERGYPRGRHARRTAELISTAVHCFPSDRGRETAGEMAHSFSDHSPPSLLHTV